MDFGIWKIFVFALLQLTRVSGSSNERLKLEKEILQNIFVTSKFHMYVRPDKNVNQTTDEPLEVFVSLYFLNIDVDERKQECTVQMYFRQEWNDSRLSYNDQGKINVLSIHDAVGLWTPDLFFVNEKFGQLHSLTKPNLFIRLYPQGRVLYSQRVTVKFSCPMDLRKYPFDTQICHLPIESYGYTANDLVLRWKTDSTLGDTEPPGFHISYSTVEDVIYTTTNNYSRIELGIHLGRLVQSQLIHVYVPLGLLVVASWISFCLRPGDLIPRLTTIGITVFTALMLVQSAEKFLYPLGYLTALDVWVGFSCFLIFAAVFENVYVVAFHSRKPLAFQTGGILNKKDVPELSDGDKKHKRTLIDVLAGKLPTVDSKVDAIARMTFPFVFVLFNVIYLIFYLI